MTKENFIITFFKFVFKFLSRPFSNWFCWLFHFFSHFTPYSQASSYICRAALDCLIYLARCFPRHFVTPPNKKGEKGPAFWNLLLQLENSYKLKKKKAEGNDLLLGAETESQPPQTATTLADLDRTILAQLFKMLKHPVILTRSLIDKMLNLLCKSSYITVNGQAEIVTLSV